MSESVLLKEFTRKDVTRLRNLFSGKVGDSVTTQVGYTKKEVEHKEGDVWEEAGRQWTIKGGIKQTYTKLDSLKKVFTTPMLCPVCNNRMKDKLDKKMYQYHGKCFTCVQSYETQLKLEGKYEEYAKNIMLNNADTFIDEAREYISEVENQTHSYYTEAGKMEDWTGPNVNRLAIEKMKGELEELKETINTEITKQADGEI